MDCTTPPYSEEAYQSAVEEVASLMKKTGFAPKTVAFVPTASYSGENLTKPAKTLLWFKGWEVERKDEKGAAVVLKGTTLCEAIDSLSPVQKFADKPVRISVQNTIKVPGATEAIIIGRVESGTVSVGSMLHMVPGNLQGECTSIEKHHTKLTIASPGDNIGFCVSGLSKDDVKRGVVFGEVGSDLPKVCRSFIAQVMVLNHPGVLRVGYAPTLDIHATHVPCKIRRIIAKLDSKTKAVVEENPTSIKAGDSATVEFIPLKPLVVEAYADFTSLGRFTLRDMNETVAIGVIKSVEKLEKQPGKVPVKST